MNLTVNKECKSTNSEFVNAVVQVIHNSHEDVSLSDLML
jgi:hypothetical protein